MPTTILDGETCEQARHRRFTEEAKVDERIQQEQEPVAWRNKDTGSFCTGGFLCKDIDKWTPLYTAPVRTKDLTDDEIMKINVDTASIVPTCDRQFHFARAVIAADREKNK